jgi:NAD(P)-dependent dehydrogenase (short-subunit alcohol dehydrogenase family)
VSGKTILITGASRGIGSATALMAADQGYDVAFTFRASQTEALGVANIIRAKGRRALAIKADAANEVDIRRTFAEVNRQFGRLDVLVYNAGVASAWMRLDEAEPALIRETLDINLLGCILHAREAVRMMSTRHGGNGGSIVFVSSLAAVHGAAGRYVWYAASKGGVNSFMKGLAREVGEEGIRVNAVSPGPIRTGISSADLETVIAETTALKRLGEPDEVAAVILFLTSDAASYMTGADVHVGGGR